MTNGTIKNTDGQMSFEELEPLEVPPETHVGPEPEATIQQAFWRFHVENPHVYDELVMLARRWVRRTGLSHCGIGMLFEVLRWRSGMRTSGDSFMLNNNYRSYYARLIMIQEPDLRGLFEIRKLHGPGSTVDGAN